MEARKVQSFVNDVWERDIVPQITDYIRIPNKSPAFDPDWEAAGHMQRAVDLISGWCKAQKIEGLTVEVIKLKGRTPLIYMEVPGEGDDPSGAAAPHGEHVWEGGELRNRPVVDSGRTTDVLVH